MSDSAQTAWRVVATKDEVTAAGLHEIQIGRHVVLLIAQPDQILAVQGLCPHQHARLSGGVLIDGALQCPHHLARFSLLDGTCTGGWQLPPLKRYAVRLDGDQVMLTDPLAPLP